MTLPVSSYEELLLQVRELTNETILLQRQLSSDLFDDNSDPTDINHNFKLIQRKNYDEEGKVLTNNAVRQSETNSRFQHGRNLIADHKNFRCYPQFSRNLETTENSIQSGELTTRLLAWRLPINPEESNVHQTKHHPTIAPSYSIETEVKRVGVEGISCDSWEVQRRYYNHRHHDITTDASLVVEEAALAAEALASQKSQTQQLQQQRQQYDAKRGPCAYPKVQNHRMMTNNSNEMNKEDIMEPEYKEEDEQKSSTPSPELYMRGSKYYNDEGSSEDDSKGDMRLPNQRLSSMSHETWPVKREVWSGQQMGFNTNQSVPTSTHNDMASVMSFSSSSATGVTSTSEIQGHRRLGAKVDVVYNLLGMLGNTEDREDMSSTLLSMSNSIDSCLVMRQSGCLPLLVQLIHAPGQDLETRERASRALHNVVHARSDERAGRREARVLRFLEQLRDYCQSLRVSLERNQSTDDLERHPGPTIAALMKLSFDEAHRHAMCQLGGLHAVAELIEMDHLAHGSECDDQNCITLRRYAGMALTNLTFGDGNNKALLCSFREFMKALVSQLRSPSDDLRQVTASVLRNLSWRADSSSKQTLREVGAVTGLMKAAMEGRKESTLKSILSALWNLSAHCSTNKIDICAVEGALAFLVDMLSYKAPSKTLAIVENAGGILRNVSSHIAVREDYRAIVRERGCLQVLLRQLRSPSLTVVSNACGALWNLSARCQQDQRLLWDLGAVPMLRSLVHSKHKMISMGSSAALKNLLSSRPGASNVVHLDSTARGLGLPTLPTLNARRQKAFAQEIDQNLAETCDNIEPSTSPVNKEDKFTFATQTFGHHSTKKLHYQNGGNPSSSRVVTVARSESRESMRSVTSTHSDTVFERVNRLNNGINLTSEQQMKQQSLSLHSAVDNHNDFKQNLEKKYTLKYKNSLVIPERLKTSTMSWSAPDQEAACSQIFMHSSIDSSTDNLQGMATSKLNAPEKDSACSYQNLVGKQETGKKSSKTSSVESENDLFGNYAETDLDQPTDYSLRYAEEDDEKQQSSAYFTGNEQEDTIKTYYTEGTPQETSLNSSRATSASDLQDDPNKSKNLLRRSLDKSKEERKLKGVKENGVDTSKMNKIKILKKDEVSSNFDIESSPESIDQVSDGDDDDDLLAACINIGMQNSRCRQSFRRNSFEETSSNLTRYQTSSALDQVDSNSEEQKSQKTEEVNEESINDVTIIKRSEKSPMSPTISDSESKSVSISMQTALEDQFTSIVPLSMDDYTFCSVEQESNCKTIEATDSPNNSQSSVDSIERSEQALLELCIKSGKSVDRVNCQFPVSSGHRDFIEEGMEFSEKHVSEDSVNEPSESNRSISHEDKKEEHHEEEEEYRRQRDPDAMIASLDRLTATLVQQTEAIRERDSGGMKQSILSSDTWNEDSPNEVSFPSISISAPLIASFKSDIPEESEHQEMTGSKIIEEEAKKLAEAVEKHCETTNLTSSVEENSTRANKIPVRKKSLPVGMIAKRALNQCQTVTSGSLENLLNECHSNLENVKPPSMMDELLPDGGDLENSMISVESITSEINDKDDTNSLTCSSDPVFDLLKPVANVLSITCMRYAESIQTSLSQSECLENINPPSLFNEVSEMDDTLCIDVEFNEVATNQPLTVDKIDDINSDNSEGNEDDATSLECHSSSVETTPKKTVVRKSLTPKEKRQIAKERYKTYTIPPELIPKCSEAEDGERAKEEKVKPRSPGSKLTPKQRRREDRMRFQTQVLNPPLELTGKIEVVEEEEDKVEGGTPTSIPTKLPIGRTYRKKRIENKERYQTRTLNDSELTPKQETLKTPTEEMQNMLEHNANIVLNTLNESNNLQSFNECSSLLDCETLSLVSDSELINRVSSSSYACQNTEERPVSEEERDPEVEEEEEELDPEEESLSESNSQPQEIKRPRIVKPGMSRDVSVDSNATDKSEPEVANQPKAIRGRRKALYSNPRKIPTPQSSPSKSGIPINRSNTSPIVRATRAVTLRQNTTHSNPNLSKAVTKIPQQRGLIKRSVSANPQETPKPLERQYTFTKDEPEVENTPTVGSPKKTNVSKIAKPKRNASKPVTNVGSVGSKSKISVRVQQNKQINNSEKTQVKKRENKTLGQRSNSNSSIIPNGKKTKEATSKIASLWKKVEENKMKQRFEKDTRQWIPSNTTETATTKVTEAATTTATLTSTATGTTTALTSAARQFRLFRSSTFEGVPNEENYETRVTHMNIPSVKSTATTTKYRNSCDLTGMSANDAPCKIPTKSRIGEGNVFLRKQQQQPPQSTSSSLNSSPSEVIDPTKRISRLGSFIRVDPNESETSIRTPQASAIVPPFNYNPKLVGIATTNIKARNDNGTEPQKVAEVVTGSARVTTV